MRPCKGGLTPRRKGAKHGFTRRRGDAGRGEARRGSRERETGGEKQESRSWLPIHGANGTWSGEAPACGKIAGKGACVDRAMSAFLGERGHGGFWLFEKGHHIETDDFESLDSNT